MPSIRALFIATLLLFCTVLSPADEMPKLQVQDGHKSEVLAMWVSDDGLRAVTVGEEGAVKIWDLVGEHVERTLIDREGLKESDSTARFTAAWVDESGAWASSGSEIKYFDLKQGRVTRRFPTTHPGTEALEFDGEFLYQFADGVRKLTLDGKEVAAIDPVGILKSASVQGGRIAMTGYDRGMSKLVVLESKNLSPIFEMNDSYRDFTAGLSVDGSKVAYAMKSVNESSCEIGIIELGSKETLHKDTIAQDIRLLPYWTRDGRLFWEGHPDQGTRLSQFFLQQGDKMTPVGPDRESNFNRVRPLKGGIVLADDRGRVAILDQDFAKTKELSPSETSLTRVLLSPSNKILLTGGTHGALRIWNLSSGREGRRLEGFPNVVDRLALSPGGSMVAAQGRDKAAVWSVDTGKILPPILPRDRVMNVGFLDEQRLIAFTGRGELVVVNLSNGEEMIRWEMGKEAPTCFAVSPKSDRVAAVIGSEIVEWSLTSKRDRLRKGLGPMRADQVLYSQDGSFVYFSSRASIQKWDFMDPDSEFQNVASTPRRCETLKADAEGLLALTEGGYLSRYSYTGELLSRVHLGNAYLFDLAENLALLTSGGSVTIVDTTTAKRIGFFSEFDQGRGWVAVDSVGRFDGNEEGFKRLAFDLGNQTYPLSAFFNKYYQPGVLKDILEVEVGTRSLPTLSAANVQKPPSVSISEPASGEVIQRRDLKVTVSVKDEGSGVSEVSLFHNGHRLPDSSMKKIDGGYQFDVKAVRGTNDIYASAYTGDRSMEARRARIRVTAPELETRKPRLHLLTVGVDEYKSGLALKFAEDDATAISKTLNSDLYEAGERRNLTNQEATLSGILQAIREISQAAEPQDAFVVYLAGHGTVVGGEYYFLPHDAEVVSDQSLASSSLSAESLAEALRAVPATKQLLVLDSCHSGAAAPILGKAVAARSGLEEIRSQQMLARTSGTFLIAATQAEAFAYEIPELKHGVLTYALLEGLGLIEGEKSKDEVTANGLLQSVSNRVPELSEQYIRERQQVIQYSSGQDFPLTR